MKKLFLIINPNDAKKAQKEFSLFNKGSFVLPCVYKIEIASEDEDSTIAALEYILKGIDFEIAINEKIY